MLIEFEAIIVALSSNSNLSYFFITNYVFTTYRNFFLQQPEDVRRTLTDKKGDTSAVRITTASAQLVQILVLREKYFFLQVDSFKS